MGTRLHIVVSEGLRDRIDGALGPGQSRGDFVRRAVEQVLEEQAGRRGVPVSPPSTGVASPAIPAPAEQPEEFEGPEMLTTPEVRRRYDATMARQAREFRPYPKGGG